MLPYTKYLNMAQTALLAGSKKLRFRNDLHKEFSITLNKRVNEYLKTKKNGRYGNINMVMKTIFMFCLYFVPYFLYLFGVIPELWFFYLMVSIMGLGKAGIGLSVMHDANHGAYSRKRWVNEVIGNSLNLIGGNSTNWKIQHNVNHHTYTNVSGMDEDISNKGGILRFNPYEERRKIHKYQYIYAWLLYGLMTFYWIVFKDAFQLKDYSKNGQLSKQTSSETRSWVWLFVCKIFYYAYSVVLPILFSPFAWWHILIGFFVMHYVAGFTLSIIFQPAHVMEENTFEDGAKLDTIEENWTVHQLKTTCNFATRNVIFTWLVGGLNHQIEHHLFPNVCHVHYRSISKIVKKTAEEYKIPYHSHKTFFSALASHTRLLYSLGR